MTEIQPDNISTDTVYYKNLVKNSRESVKKNIELYNINAIQKIKDSELYTYNYNTETDSNKKHIGFIIGDNGGNYKTPTEVINETREGIDVDNMTSILWKAVQEQQEIIENLQKQIDELKGEK